jgi:hypothetical protein
MTYILAVIFLTAVIYHFRMVDEHEVGFNLIIGGAMAIFIFPAAIFIIYQVIKKI